MNQINSYNINKKLILSNNLNINKQKLSKNKLNSYLQEHQNTNKQIKSNEENFTNINDFWLKDEPTDANNNSENNFSSILEIIEYPLSEKQKNINKQNSEKDRHNERDLKYYKMPVDINGDSDDDIYINEEEFEKSKSNNKTGTKNTNFHNSSKTSTVSNNELFFDYKNKKKIVVILKNTKKYHQDLKVKINNFKKLIYSSKEKGNDNIKAFSNKKNKKEIDFKFNTNQKDNKKEENLFKYSYQKNSFLISSQKEYLPIQKKIKNIAKERSIFDTKGNEKNFNSVTFSNDSTIKSIDKMSNLYNNKIQPSKKVKKIKNNLTKEIGDINKNLIKKNNMNSLIYINNNTEEKSPIANIKNNKNYFEIKLNRSHSKDKFKNKINIQKNNYNRNKNSILLYNVNNNSKNDNERYNKLNSNLTNSNYLLNSNTSINEKSQKYDSIKIKNINKNNNQKILYNINHIFPSTSQKNDKKIDKFKKNIIYINRKPENNNPFKKNSSRTFLKVKNKEIYMNKGNNIINTINGSNKKTKDNIFVHTPNKNDINYSLQSIKE